jgi:hypothetical protein
MNVRIEWALVFVMVMCLPRISEAQVVTPAAHTVAIGGDMGFIAVKDSEGTAAFAVDAFAEYYATPRVSVRGLYGWSRTDLEVETQRSLRRQHVLLNVIYNWDLGRFRPFGTVGGGAFFVQPQQDGQSVGASLTKPGASLGWGAEYYLSVFAVRTEMNVLILGKESSELDAKALSGFTWTFGVKVPF